MPSKPTTKPAVVVASEPAVVVAPKTKKVKKEDVAPKEPKEVTAPKVKETKVVEEPKVVDQVVVDGETSVNEQSIEFLAKLQQMSTLISSLKTEYRVLEKKWTRELKAAQKQSSKRKKRAGNRAPSGFVKPTRISDELALFLEKPSGSEMARTDVTREINKYIRSNSLQDSVNGRKINADVKLASLLKLSKTDELTYFNLQRFMSPHFYKAVKVEPVVAV